MLATDETQGASRGQVQGGCDPPWYDLQLFKISNILGRKKKHDTNMKSFRSGAAPPKKSHGSTRETQTQQKMSLEAGALKKGSDRIRGRRYPHTVCSLYNY